MGVFSFVDSRGKFRTKLKSLSFATGKGWRNLTELEVIQSGFDHDAKGTFQKMIEVKEALGLGKIEIKNVRYTFTVPFEFQDFTSVPQALTFLADHIRVRQEIHFHFIFANSLTCLTSSTFYIKGKITGR